MRLVHLALLAGLVSVPVRASDCLPATAEFERVAPLAARVVELISEHRVDWGVVSIDADNRAAYTRVKVALDAYLPALKQWIDAAQPALGYAAACRLGEPVADGQIADLLEAVQAAQSMVAAGAPYLEAYAALPGV